MVVWMEVTTSSLLESLLLGTQMVTKIVTALPTCPASMSMPIPGDLFLNRQTFESADFRRSGGPDEEGTSLDFGESSII